MNGNAVRSEARAVRRLGVLGLAAVAMLAASGGAAAQQQVIGGHALDANPMRGGGGINTRVYHGPAAGVEPSRYRASIPSGRALSAGPSRNPGVRAYQAGDAMYYTTWSPSGRTTVIQRDELVYPSYQPMSAGASLERARTGRAYGYQPRSTRSVPIYSTGTISAGRYSALR